MTNGNCFSGSLMSMHLEETPHLHMRGNGFLAHEKLAGFIFILSIAPFAVCTFKIKIMGGTWNTMASLNIFLRNHNRLLFVFKVHSYYYMLPWYLSFKTLLIFLGERRSYILGKKKTTKNLEVQRIASAAFQGDEIIYFKLGKNLWTVMYLWNNVR